MIRSVLTLAALAGALACSASQATAAGKDCDDPKPAPVAKKRPARKLVRVVHQPAQAPVVAVVVPTPAPAPVANCVNITSGRADSLSMAWTDWQCVTLQKARLLQSIGQPQAAVALLCGDPQMHEALESAGTACPQPRAAPEFARPPEKSTALAD